MNTNSKQSTGRTHSGVACRIIGVLFGLFAFIWLPTPEVDACQIDPSLLENLPFSSSQLLSPRGGTDEVTVFRWTRSNNPAVHSYCLIIAKDFQYQIVFDLLRAGDMPLQVAVKFNELLKPGYHYLEWAVFGLDKDGNPIEWTEPIQIDFEVTQDETGYAVITGLVKSDFNQAALAGAQVTLLGQHGRTDNGTAVTVFNGEFIVIAVLARTYNNDYFESYPFPIMIETTKVGFKSAPHELKASDSRKGIELVMEKITDSDGDGILDVVENASCTDVDDADTDDDGIADGDEDANQNGVRDPGETNPCAADSDWDGISDKVEIDLPCLDANDPDTDDDEIADGVEDTNKNGVWDPGEINPCDPDSDGDGIPDGVDDSDGDGIPDKVERPFWKCVDANDADTDDDGIADGVEDTNKNGNWELGETNPCDPDSDGDGISDGVEYYFCLDANDADTDDDGIADGNEDADHDGAVDAFETDPCETDTDNDGLLDGTEIGLTAPQGSDTDLDVFVPDADQTTTTDPLDEDSDDDGRLDGEEDANHNGQVDVGETDPIFLNGSVLPAILLLLLGG